jgi:hypothetical protein
MLPHELLRYIGTSLRSHLAYSVIESNLLAKGWQPDIVRKAMLAGINEFTTIRRLQITSILLISISLLASSFFFIGQRNQTESFIGSRKNNRNLAVLSSPALFVAVNGSDTNNGSIEQPFATITRARDAIRALNQDGVTVYVRSGTYYVTSSVEFTAADAGSAENPNVYRNYPSEYPIFSTGTEITLSPGLTGIISLNLADYSLGGTEIHQIIKDGERQQIARTPNAVTPNYTLQNPWQGSFAAVASDVATTGNRSVITYENGSIVDPITWSAPTNARAYVSTGDNWWANRLGVSSINPGNRTITLNGLTSYEFRYTASGYGQRSFFYIENLPEFIDVPGEWSQAGNTISYYVNGTTTGAEKLHLSYGTRPLVINNSSHLVFKNLSFNGTGRQTSVTPGSTIQITDSDNITLDGLAITNGAGTGVQINGVSDYITVRNSRITDMRGSGIRGDTDTTGADAYFKPLLSANHIYENNFISGIGFDEALQNVGVYANFPGTIVRNNTVENLHRSGIQSDLRHANITIEGNIIRKTMRAARDGGGIYINTFSQPGQQRSWLARGMRITNNLVEDTGGYGWDADANSFVFNIWTFGIYLDDWTSSALVDKNVVRDSGGACLLIHAGRDNTFENNICYHASQNSDVFIAHEDPNSSTTGGGTYGELDPKWTEVQNLTTLGYDRAKWLAAFPDLTTVPQIQERGNIMQYNRIRKNIFVKKNNTSPNMYNLRMLSTTNTIDQNIYYDEGAAPFSVTGTLSANCPGTTAYWLCTSNLNFSQWQTLGFDQNSQVANPLFTNLTAGDYSLQSGSPATAIGFEALSTTTMGTRSVLADVGVVNNSASTVQPNQYATVSWSPKPPQDNYRYRYQITKNGTPVGNLTETEANSIILNAQSIGEGDVTVCISAIRDIRFPDNGQPIGWGPTTCSSTLAFVAAQTPSPSSSSTATTQVSPAITPGQSVTSTPRSTQKPAPASSASTNPSGTPTTSPNPSQSPSATGSPSNSPAPAAITAANPTPSPQIVTVSTPDQSANADNSRLIQPILGGIGLISLLGALFTSLMWAIRSRRLFAP